MADQEQAVRSLTTLTAPDGPGAQYILLDRERVIFEDAVGLANISSRMALRPEHTMAAFSMTKTLTAIAALQLSERGKIGLDEPAAAYVNHPYDPAITIRQVISHTAGIPNPIPLRWTHPADSPDFDEKAALARVLAANYRLRSAPGQKFGYSNIGYWLLGEVIEAAARQDYRAYMQENLFAPLGLSSGQIGFSIPDPARHANGYLKKYSGMNLLKSFLIDSHVWGQYEGAWLRINNVYVDGAAYGGAIGSARSFSRLLQDLLGADSLLLGEAGRRELFTRQRLASGEKIEMTLGWHVGMLAGSRYYFKEGGGAGFRCEMRIYPDRGLASVLMANRTSLNTSQALEHLDSSFMT